MLYNYCILIEFILEYGSLLVSPHLQPKHQTQCEKNKLQAPLTGFYFCWGGCSLRAKVVI